MDYPDSAYDTTFLFQPLRHVRVHTGSRTGKVVCRRLPNCAFRLADTQGDLFI